MDDDLLPLTCYYPRQAGAYLDMRFVQLKPSDGHKWASRRRAQEREKALAEGREVQEENVDWTVSGRPCMDAP